MTEYRYETDAPTWSDDFLWSRVLEILKASAPPPRAIFELGCGNGSTARMLAAGGYSVVGVDPSVSGIEQAKRHESDLLRFEVGSTADDLAGKYGQFPVLVSLEVIEHCPSARETGQKTSGTQSLTRSARAGENIIGVVNATTTMPVGWGDSLVFYVLMNECATPTKLIAQWVATDGSWGGASWGQSVNGYHHVGSLPTAGEWTRIEIPASLLNLEAKDIKGFYFFVYDGQAWVDRVGVDDSGSASIAPEPSSNVLMATLRERLSPWTARPRVTLFARAEYIGSESAGDMRRISFYTPELNLMAETEATPDASPAIAYEYLWFGGQPVAQVASTTGEIAWYFNDHLGTPILQTNATGDVVWRVEYEPYGEVYAHREGALRHQPLRFPGQESADTGDAAYNIFRWYRGGWGRYTQADPLGLQEDEFTLYAYGHSSPLGNTDPLGLVSMAPGEKPCAGFDRALKKLQKLKKNCNCTDFFKYQFGQNLNDLIDGVYPQVKLKDFAPTNPGQTPCSADPGVIYLNKSYCGRLTGGWFGGNTTHVLLHELAHYADCNGQRYPPGGSTEEGVHAEKKCFGKTISNQTPGPLGPPLMGPFPF